MKYARLFPLLAAGFCLSLSSCSSRVQNSNNNSEANINVASTDSPKPTNETPRTLNVEALEAAKQFWDERMAKCGDKYYWAPYDKPVRSQYFYQCRYEPSIGVDGSELAPRALTEAERLNGIDPLPVAWEGLMSMSINVCRKFYEQTTAGQVYSPDGWSQWEDQELFTVRMKNIKGKWDFVSGGFNSDGAGNIWQVRKIGCPAVEKLLTSHNLER